MKNLFILICLMSSFSAFAQSNTQNFDRSVDRAIATYQMDASQATQFKNLFKAKYDATKNLTTQKLTKKEIEAERESINSLYNESMLAILNDEQDKLFMANISAVSGKSLPKNSVDPKKVKESKKMEF